MASAAKQKRKVPKSRLPDPLPLGFSVKDSARKKEWFIGKEIGSGGFGRVYLATDDSSCKNFDYVLKVEFHGNGPLFSEIHCYMAFGKLNDINDWSRKKKLPYLGLSPYYGFGSFEYQGSKYRFLVLQRFGTDLMKILKEKGNKFSLQTTCTVGVSVLNTLEYIHSQGYLHLDVKAANLLLGHVKGTENHIYLLDMGMGTKYLTNGEHRKEIPDPKKAHNGTIEYMSRDSHKGTPCTRRADLETLGYNMAYVLSGELPWENVSDCKKVHSMKESFMNDVKKSLKSLFFNDVPPGLVEYFDYVKKLQFEESPNYDLCRKLLMDGAKKKGLKLDGKLNFDEKKSKKVTEDEDSSSTKENGKTKKKVPVEKKTPLKRKREKPTINLDPNITPTPAMLAILNKNN